MDDFDMNIIYWNELNEDHVVLEELVKVRKILALLTRTCWKPA